MSHFQTLLCLLKAKPICLTGCLREAQTSYAVIPPLMASYNEVLLYVTWEFENPFSGPQISLLA